ncbi:unnamed protein product [Caenorhabditis nigoni]
MDEEYDEATTYQRLTNYIQIYKACQKLLNPATTLNYKTMSHEKLIELYNRQIYFDLWYTEQAAKSINSKKTSTKITVTIDWTSFQDMSNRVKTAATGLFWSMKKRIVKKNKQEDK